MDKRMILENVKGTKDTPPEIMLIREELLAKIKSVFRSYGFVPLDTPALENYDILSAKGGKDIDKETYNFTIAGRRLALKYDQTVPLSRYVAMNPQIILPFKRYQYDRAWRYGDIAKGRYREFYQFDIDTVGSYSMLAEAEILSAINDVMNALKIPKFKIRLSNRKLLNGIIKATGITSSNELDVFRVVDKLDKIGRAGVISELKKLNMNEKDARAIMEYTGIRGKPLETLKKVEKTFSDNLGYKELERLFEYAGYFGILENLELNLSIARGLDYYTGPVFETIIEGVNIGSVCSGGRYDDMIGFFLGSDVPATGISIGMDRLIDAMKLLGLIKERKSATDIFIAIASESSIGFAIEISRLLRRNGFNIEMDLIGRSLKSQLKYADKMGVERIIVIGEREQSERKFTIKNMNTKEQEVVDMEKVQEYKKKRLDS